MCTAWREIISRCTFKALLIAKLLKNVSVAHKTAVLYSTDAPCTAYDAKVFALNREGAGDAGSIFDGVRGGVIDGVQ